MSISNRSATNKEGKKSWLTLKKKISGNVTIVLIRNMQNTEKRQLGPKVYRHITFQEQVCQQRSGTTNRQKKKKWLRSKPRLFQGQVYTSIGTGSKISGNWASVLVPTARYIESGREPTGLPPPSSICQTDPPRKDPAPGGGWGRTRRSKGATPQKWKVQSQKHTHSFAPCKPRVLTAVLLWKIQNISSLQ